MIGKRLIKFLGAWAMCLVFTQAALFAGEPAENGDGPAPPSGGEAEKEKGDEKPMLIVKPGQEISVESILNQIHKMTGLSIVTTDRRIHATKIKFVSNVRADYDVLEAILKVNGIYLEHKIIDDEKIIQVHTKNSAKPSTQYEPTRIREAGEAIPKDKQVITQIFNIKYGDADQIARMMERQIMDRSISSIMAVRGHQFVIVKSFAPEVEYYGQVIKALDIKPDDMQMEVVDIKYAYASELASTISSIMSKRSQVRGRRTSTQTTQPQLVADSRTNKIIIMALEDELEDIKHVINLLDRKVDTSRGGTIHVYRLKNTNATKLATALQSILSSRNRQTSPRRGQAPPGQEQVESRVVADEQTNSLIIESDQRSYDEIVEIVKQLDVRRPQVFIEAAIVEVSTSSQLNFGFELASVDTTSKTWKGAGGTVFGLSSYSDDSFDSLEKIPNLATGGTAFLFKEKLGRIPILMQALQANTDLNVLSTPRILTNDNEKGEIRVTDNVAVLKSTSTSISVSNNYSYESAGITLSITPHISADDYLRLEIDLTVEDFERSLSTDPSIPPAKKSRQIIGTLTVPDKEIVIIGGLTSKKINTVVNKIPLLGDIPILGQLFSYETDSEEKRNLYVFISPSIMREERFEDLVRETSYHRENLKQEGGQIDYMERLLDKRARRLHEYRQTETFVNEIEPIFDKLRIDFEKKLAEEREAEMNGEYEVIDKKLEKDGATEEKGIIEEEKEVVPEDKKSEPEDEYEVIDEDLED